MNTNIFQGKFILASVTSNFKGLPRYSFKNEKLTSAVYGLIYDSNNPIAMKLMNHGK